MSRTTFASQAILWRLQGSRGTVITCCLDPLPDGKHEIRILHGGDLQMRETHATLRDAQNRAATLATTLLKDGWARVEGSS
jgi:hypothetical protein